MDSADVCPNCGKHIHYEGHRCLPNEEDMIYQIDDNDDSTPFLDKIVKESQISVESDPTSMKKDFSEELEENSLERTEGEYGLLRSPSEKKPPLFSEGNPNSPPEEESFMEENQEVGLEEICELGENFENVLESLEIDTSLYSDNSVNIISQLGNPLDDSPSGCLFMDDSRNSNQREDKNVKSAVACKRQITSLNAAEGKTDPDLRSNMQNISLNTSKGDCGRLNPSSLLVRNEPQNALEEVPVAYPSDSQAGTSRTDGSGHSRTSSPLKHSPQKTITSLRCEKELCSKRNCKYHQLSHKQEKLPKRASNVLSRGSQSSPNRTDHSEYSKTISPSKYSQVKSLPRDECGKTLYSKRDYKHHTLSHEQEKSPKGASAALSSGSQVDPTWPDLSDDSRNATNQSPEKSFPCSECGISFKKSSPRNTLFPEHQSTSEEASADFSSSQAGPSRQGRSKHSRTESKNSPSKPSDKGSYPCDKCDKVLSYKRNYKNHEYLHKNLKPHACKECGKAFATKTYLGKHLRRHTGERRYQCSVCNNRYATLNYLHQHYRIHTGEQPYVCERCGKAFTFQTNYAKHRRGHTE